MFTEHYQTDNVSCSLRQLEEVLAAENRGSYVSLTRPIRLVNILLAGIYPIGVFPLPSFPSSGEK